MCLVVDGIVVVDWVGVVGVGVGSDVGCGSVCGVCASCVFV